MRYSLAPLVPFLSLFFALVSLAPVVGSVLGSDTLYVWMEGVFPEPGLHAMKLCRFQNSPCVEHTPNVPLVHTPNDFLVSTGTFSSKLHSVSIGLTPSGFEVEAESGNSLVLFGSNSLYSYSLPLSNPPVTSIFPELYFPQFSFFNKRLKLAFSVPASTSGGHSLYWNSLADPEQFPGGYTVLPANTNVEGANIVAVESYDDFVVISYSNGYLHVLSAFTHHFSANSSRCIKRLPTTDGNWEMLFLSS